MKYIYINHTIQGIECTTGTCAHAGHQYTGILLIIATTLIITISVRALWARQ